MPDRSPLPPPPRRLPPGTRLRVLASGPELRGAHGLLALSLTFALFGVGVDGADPAFALLPLGLLLLAGKIVGSAVLSRRGQAVLMEQGVAVVTTEVDAFTPPTRHKPPKYRPRTQLVSLRYTLDGRSYTHVVRTKDPARLLDEAQEQLLVDPNEPSRAVAMAELPAWLQVDGAGWMEVPGGWPRALLGGVAPLALVVPVVLYRVFWM